MSLRVDDHIVNMFADRIEGMTAIRSAEVSSILQSVGVPATTRSCIRQRLEAASMTTSVTILACDRGVYGRTPCCIYVSTGHTH